MLGLSPRWLPAKAPLADYATDPAGALGGPHQHRFSPYSHNYGSVAAVGGADFVVVASDTRLSSGYSILTREQSKLFDMGPRTVLGSCGCWCDILTLTRLMETRAKVYLHSHDKIMTTSALAQMLSTMLYAKRFFPYYAQNLLAGLDETGRGVVYTYDPVGSMEKFKFGARGSAEPLMSPLLDNQVGQKNMKDGNPASDVTMDQAINILHDLFISASEREIHTGDAIHFKIVTKTGVEERTVGLRRD
eukprot:maker-scaffold407_size180809-snap-gene-0.35 protein:Tk12631 transcript:maker-scaffold407_size180809-snap-gene-0.35-mRNA-1 annotation:"proteasome subunit beta type-1 precursor"